MLNRPLTDEQKRLVWMAISLVLATRPEEHREPAHGIHVRVYYWIHSPEKKRYVQSDEYWAVPAGEGDEQFSEFSEEKAERLSENSHVHWAASQSRNREKKQFGGAMFIDDQKKSMISISGLSDSKGEEEAAILIASVLLRQSSFGRACNQAMLLKNRLFFQALPALYDLFQENPELS